jgi:hypothetical protein
MSSRLMLWRFRMVFVAFFSTMRLGLRVRHRPHAANAEGSTHDSSLDAGRSHDGVTLVAAVEAQSKDVETADARFVYGAAQCVEHRVPVRPVAENHNSPAGSSERDCHRVRRFVAPLGILKRVAIVDSLLVGATRSWYLALISVRCISLQRAASGGEPQKVRRFFR